MSETALYGQHAILYDPIYSNKPYGREAARIRELLREEGVADGARIVEAACGTGSYLVHLAHWYEAIGFDLSEEMVRLARRKLPRLELFCADMRDFRLDEPVDAVLCLFSSIGYLLQASHLTAAASAFFRCLRPGGVTVIEPWLTPEDYREGTVHMTTYSGRHTKVCRQNLSKREGNLSVLAFHWLVTTSAGTTDYFVEEHRLRLRSRQEMTQALEAAGFSVRFEPEGLMPERGLYVCRRAS